MQYNLNINATEKPESKIRVTKITIYWIVKSA